MSRRLPIELSTDLPAPGVGNERPGIDFKRSASSSRFELAKDIAALANGAGGTILVGALAKGEIVERYQPLTAADASAAQRAFEEAVRDYCRPAPIVATAHIPFDDGVVLAVNTWPMLGAAVGVRVPKSEAQRLEDLFHYPVRVGAQTRFITPDQMHMYVDASFRRKLLLLEGAEGQTVILSGRSTSSAWMSDALLLRVDPQANALHLQLTFSRGPASISLSLDLVTAVWRGVSRLHLSIPGCIQPMHWSDPANADLHEAEAIFLEVRAPVQEQGPRELRVNVTRFPHAESLGREVLQGYRAGLRYVRQRLQREG